MIESLGSAVNLATNGCVALIALFSNTISFSFNLSYFIGRLIVKLAVALTSLFVECILTLQELVHVLAEDYFVFMSDLSSALSLLLKTLIELGESFFYAVLGTCSSLGHVFLGLQNFSVLVVSSFVNLVNYILTSFHYSLVLVKNALVLVGLTSWDIFVFFPNSLFTLKQALVVFFIQCMVHLRDLVKSLRSRLLEGYQETVCFVSDIPRESLYGLFVCVFCGLILIKYHRSIIPLLVRNVLYILSQSQKTLMAAWMYLEAFTLWLLTNQMTPSFNGIRLFATANGGAPRDAAGVAPNNEPLNERDGAIEEHAEQAYRKPIEPEDHLCVVCQDSERCTIILPCRHVCLCYDCCAAIKRTHGRCPICRHIVRRTMRVFI
ncbi:uncharacterized protein LOC117653687 [Thrips palmi]|uniref:Uncharacterized protein LOC117653687 n=1 Tax=Thrips palmi TaxID=161013 RepID=A0A6P9AB92_THRPL|nr:uncharacterized protein LOC117653687 [Thrips palmi]